MYYIYYGFLCKFIFLEMQESFYLLRIMRSVILWIFHTYFFVPRTYCTWTLLCLISYKFVEIYSSDQTSNLLFSFLFHLFPFFLIASLTWHALSKVITLLVTTNVKGESNQWNKHLSIAGSKTQYPSRRLDLPAKVSFLYSMFSELGKSCDALFIL